MIAALPPAASAQGTAQSDTISTQAPTARFPGMDQSVNVGLAEKAGIPAREPFINVEQWGELWNLLLLLGGGACGFVIGRRWDQLWGRPR
jgi:hypothetical protein